MTHWQNKCVDGRAVHHMDSPGDRGHLSNVLVPLGQSLNHELHCPVPVVRWSEQRILKLLHILRDRIKEKEEQEPMK